MVYSLGQCSCAIWQGGLWLVTIFCGANIIRLWILRRGHLLHNICPRGSRRRQTSALPARVHTWGSTHSLKVRTGLLSTLATGREVIEETSRETHDITDFLIWEYQNKIKETLSSVIFTLTFRILNLQALQHMWNLWSEYHWTTKRAILENRRSSTGTMTRYPFQPTSLAARSQFVSMWVRGKTCKEIARETGVSSSTVCRWINRWKEEGNVFNRTKNGHSCIATEILKLDKFVQYHNEMMFQMSLQHSLVNSS